MSFSRYRKDSILRGGKIRGTSIGLLKLRRRIQRGEISLTTIVLKEGQRLDQIAQQAPPGTKIRVPTDLNQIEELF